MTLRSIVIEVGYPTFLKYDTAAHVITHGFTNVMGIRGVSSILDLGGQVVHNAVRTPPPLPDGAFYSSKIWVGNCPPCPPAKYASESY